MMRTAIAIGLLMAASAARADAPTMPTPSKDLDGVKPLLKTWSCTGTGPTGDKSSATVTYEKRLDGFWFRADIKIAKSKAMPAIEGENEFGIDPIKHDWVLEGWDNFGGTIHLRSPDGLTWSGTSVDGGRESPATVTLAIDAKTKHHKVTQSIDGKKVFDYDCK
jgi:hypothetical protein